MIVYVLSYSDAENPEGGEVGVFDNLLDAFESAVPHWREWYWAEAEENPNVVAFLFDKCWEWRDGLVYQCKLGGYRDITYSVVEHRVRSEAIGTPADVYQTEGPA